MQDLQRATIGVEQLDVLACAERLPESHDATRMEKLLGNDLIKEAARIVVELACSFADLGVVENRGEGAVQVPGLEERLPGKALRYRQKPNRFEICSGPPRPERVEGDQPDGPNAGPSGLRNPTPNPREIAASDRD